MFEEKVELVKRDDEATRQEDRWYTSNEYFFMRRKATNMAKRMDELDKGDGDSSRGLEIVESTSVEERNEKIKQLVQAVIQKQKQDADPEAIAAISRKASQDSIQESLRKAKDDEKHAKHILADVRKEYGGKKKKLSSKLKKLFLFFRKKKRWSSSRNIIFYNRSSIVSSRERGCWSFMFKCPDN